jgi:hypothetical protein
MRVMQELIRLSTRLIVMSERRQRMLEEVYKAPADRIDLIPHGIPDMPFIDPNFYKDQFGVEGKRVLLTFGLISPGKRSRARDPRIARGREAVSRLHVPFPNCAQPRRR